MAINNKLVLLLLSVIGISLIGGIVEAQDICPTVCHPAKYMTCPSTGNVLLDPVCNCCLAPEGECTLHLDDDQEIQCESRSKACPKNIDPSKYMTCSYTGNVQLKSAANCCVAPNGCFLHLFDGEIKNCTATPTGFV